MIGQGKTAATAVFLVGAASLAFAGDGQWTSEGFQRSHVYSLALGQPPRTLFAGTAYGVFRSTEAGMWTRILDATTEQVAVDPSDPEVLYTVGGGLFKTTDGGDHFQALAGLSFSFLSIAVDPGQPSTLYAGGTTEAGGIVSKSDDGGASWSALDTASLVDGIAALVIDPRRRGTVYAGASVYYDYPGYPPGPDTLQQAVIGTEDGGATWRALLPSSHPEGGIFSVPALAVDPETGTLYAGTHDSSWGSVFHSSDFGATWTRTEIGLGLKVSGVNALLVDPTPPKTIYAGTWLAGVFRSLDGGATWTPMSDGLVEDETYGYRGLLVRSLVLDPDGVLRAGTENGVFAIRPNAPSSPCTPAARELCLLGGRYRVTVMAQIPEFPVDHPKRLELTRGVVVEQADRFGSFSFPAFTGDATFPEVVVKMVGPFQDQRAWFFHSGLTNLPYVVSVTDTATGRTKTYANNGASRFCGGADTAAFYDDADPCLGCWDYLMAANVGSGGWMPEENGALSLLDGRFSVTLSAFSARHNRTESGVAVGGSDRSGYFSLPGFTGDATFPEVYVKMIDFTAISGHFWFFYAGLTSLDYTLTVTDTVTGAVRIYESPGGFCGSADTEAFAN